MNEEILTGNVRTIQTREGEYEYMYILNPAMDAMRKLQEAIKGAAEEAGWKSDDDVVAYIKEVRAELATERTKRRENYKS